MAGQNEQSAIAVQLFQSVAHHIAGVDDIRVALDPLFDLLTIFALGHRAGKHQLFICMGFEVSLYQIQRALFGRNAAHIKDVAFLFQSVFFTDDVAGVRFIEPHCVRDQNRRAVVIFQEIVPLAF